MSTLTALWPKLPITTKNKSNQQKILHAAHELQEDTTNDTTKLKRTEPKRKKIYFNFLLRLVHVFEYPNRRYYKKFEGVHKFNRNLN